MSSLQTEFVSSSFLPLRQAGGISRLAYRVGDISFGMHCEEDGLLELDAGMLGFAVDPGDCDVDIGVSLADELKVPRHTPLFHSGGLWSLFEEQDGYRFSFLRWFGGETPYKEAWFDREFKNGEVVLSRKFFSAAKPYYPMEYPLDELLMIHRLACGEGLEVHAVGIVDERGRGHLFLGHSGAGKSTTARLWRSRPGVHILSDDRIILRERAGKIWMYGTPWHGDAGISSPDSAPLDEIYFLEHWHTNEIAPLRAGLGAAELFARCFVPRHSPQALQFALHFLERVAREVPCQVFRFVPDERAVEAIRRARD